jgi:hypothetical protein
VNRELGTVGVVVKDWVINDERNKTVKCLRLDPKLSTKSLRAMKPPVVKEVKLQ